MYRSLAVPGAAVRTGGAAGRFDRVLPADGPLYGHRGVCSGPSPGGCYRSFEDPFCSKYWPRLYLLFYHRWHESCCCYWRLSGGSENVQRVCFSVLSWSRRRSYWYFLDVYLRFAWFQILEPLFWLSFHLQIINDKLEGLSSLNVGVSWLYLITVIT